MTKRTFITTNVSYYVRF